MSLISTQKAAQPLRAYLIAGVLTIIPLWVTWLVFSFLFSQLSSIGVPWVRMLSAAIREDAPLLNRLLLAGWCQSILAVLVTLPVLYVLGWAATRVLGKRVIMLVDRVMDSIPLVEKIYGGTKRLVASFEHKPSDVQRVVLVEFPATHMGHWDSWPASLRINIRAQSWPWCTYRQLPTQPLVSSRLCRWSASPPPT